MRSDSHDTTVLIGPEVTRERVLAELPRHRIIHYAAHGDLTDASGEGVPGCVELAPSAEDRTWLHAHELMGLELNADLVVLSACSTGLGRESADGTIGLSRALLTAGAATVLVSLWKVDDRCTPLLMNSFYRHYLAHGDKAAALRLAMIEIRKFDADPRSWAGFTLIGERYDSEKEPSSTTCTPCW